MIFILIPLVVCSYINKAEFDNMLSTHQDVDVYLK